MFIYLLKMIACSGIFLAFYFFVLQREKMLLFNRAYLLGALVCSIIIPFITFTTVIPVPAVSRYYAVNDVAPAVVQPLSILERLLTIIKSHGFPGVLLIGSCYFLIRFCKSLFSLFRIAEKSGKAVWNNIPLRLHPFEQLPYSAAGKIFLNDREWASGRVEEAILVHEKAHIDQRHFYDILFVEVMQVFFWFNPFIYLYKKAIMLNHEYLADAAVVAETHNSIGYQQLLLQKVYVNNHIPLASSFYFFTTKKRLLMLQKTFNRKRAPWLAFTIVPLFISVTFAFCNRVEKKVVAESADTIANSKAEKNDTSTVKNDAQGATGITDAEMEEVVAGAGKITIRKDGRRVIKESDWPAIERAQLLYSRMSDAQRASLKARNIFFPEEPLPPPPPKVDVRKFTPPKVIMDLPEGPGATADELRDYEALIKKMKVGDKGYKDDPDNRASSVKLLTIYKKMTIKQREGTSELPPPPPPPKVRRFAPPKIVKDTARIEEVTIEEIKQ